MVQNRWCALFGLIGVVTVANCGCGGKAVHPMEIAADAGNQAVNQLDSNKDGTLDYNELAKAPGLRVAVAKIKKLARFRGPVPPESQIRAAKITAQEIDARIQEWKARGTGRITALCRVTRKGSPLVGAEVKFVPEAFLGPDLPAGTGTTTDRGVALVSQPSQKGEDERARGMCPGFYRVEITKGTEIPAKYNTATIFGQEVAVDALGISTGGIAFDLDY
jgi:hypothetical protein